MEKLLEKIAELMYKENELSASKLSSDGWQEASYNISKVLEYLPKSEKELLYKFVYNIISTLSLA